MDSKPTIYTNLAERVFEASASIKQDKTAFMSEADFFQCLTLGRAPRSFFDHHESLAFRMADANGDGHISAEEFKFFLVVFSTNPELIKPLFDNCGGSATLEEFTDIMEQAKRMNPVTNRRFRRNSWEADDAIPLSCRRLFKEVFAGKSEVTWQDYLDLKDLINEEVLFYEFHQFSVDAAETIPTEDFFTSLVQRSTPSNSSLFLKRIETIHFKGRLTFQQFFVLMSVLGDASSKAKQAIVQEMGGLVPRFTRKEFRELLRRFASVTPALTRAGLTVDSGIADQLFTVLDVKEREVVDLSDLQEVILGLKKFQTEKSLFSKLTDAFHRLGERSYAFLRF